ncbi:hypothetical protein AB0M02_35745 [Actinoplanes sp. NPDC051861]|uniref:hypothetical protein n=1 Tax=Actinoplanes sp. NPDC051861 TaxID=3155170 RepID=UPI00342D4CC2
MRLDVVAPAAGRASVTVPRLKHTGPMRVTGSRAVVIGDNNRVEVRYRYRIKQVQVERRDAEAVRRAVHDFHRGRDLAKPVTRGEFNRFRSCLRSRLEWPPPTPPIRHLSQSIRSASGFEIDGCSGVMIGDHNRIRTREDLVVRRCAVRLDRLVHRNDDLARDLFARVRVGEDAVAGLGDAVNAGLRRSPAESLSGLGGIDVEPGRAGSVAGAGAVVIGQGNRTTERIERTATGKVVVDDPGSRSATERRAAMLALRLTAAQVVDDMQERIRDAGPDAGELLAQQEVDRVDQQVRRATSAWFEGESWAPPTDFFEDVHEEASRRAAATLDELW